MSNAPLRVGYVHVGPREHGVSRYGRVLAAAARRHPDLVVAEVDLDLATDPVRRSSGIHRAAESLAGVDVVHLQYNQHWEKCLWGARWDQLVNLRQFARLARVPFVVTAHDIYDQPAWGGLATFLRVRFAMAGRRAAQGVTRPFRAGASLRSDRRGRADWRGMERNAYPDAFTLWWLNRHAHSLLVCSAEEAGRLNRFLDRARLRTIPHFVEARPAMMARDEAKRALGFTGRRIVTQLGFIHRRKGYDLLIESMRYLAPDVTVVLAGGPAVDHDAYLAQLVSQARAHGRANLHVTGHLPEEELNVWLAATDLAVCPFASVAASGSLSTWISAATPVLASDLPLFAEYEALAPGAIRTFSPYAASVLAAEITDRLGCRDPNADAAVRRLRDTLSVDAVLELHRAVYARAADSGPRHVGSWRRGVVSRA